MPITKKGSSTKTAIYEAAKSLYAKKGLKSVTLAEICKKSKTQLGTVTYYYPTKADFVRQVFTDYAKTISDCVRISAPEIKGYWHYGVSMLVYYWFIYKNQASRDFYLELLSSAMFEEVFESVAEIFFAGRIDANDPDYLLYRRADRAVRQAFNLDFVEKGDFSLDAVGTLLRNIHVVNQHFYPVSKETLDDVVAKGKEFILSHPDMHFDLLK